MSIARPLMVSEQIVVWQQLVRECVTVDVHCWTTGVLGSSWYSWLPMGITCVWQCVLRPRWVLTSTGCHSLALASCTSLSLSWPRCLSYVPLSWLLPWYEGCGSYAEHFPLRWWFFTIPLVPTTNRLRHPWWHHQRWYPVQAEKLQGEWQIVDGCSLLRGDRAYLLGSRIASHNPLRQGARNPIPSQPH